MKKILLILLSLISTQCLADYEQDMTALQKGMPSSVSKFIDRQVMCNHWSGEEPYDKERLQEINAAADRLKCNDLNKDEIKLKKRYKSKPNIIKRINKAKEFY